MAKQWIPHNYQLTSMSFLIDNPFSGLLLDPGMGKSSISLSVMKILRGCGKIRSVLMICPIRVANNVWPAEIAKWVNFNETSYTILHGKGKESLWGERKDVYLMNPEGLPWLYDALLDGLQAGKKCPFDTLWIDESTKYKNPTAKTRFMMIKDMLPLFKRRHIMTGTPAPRGLIDLWSQMYILDEGEALTPNFYRFRKRYFFTEDWNKFKWILKDGSADKIHEAVAPKLLEMSAEDYLDMPPLVYNNISVTLPPKAMKQYKQMETEFFVKIEGSDITAQATAQASAKCRQMANGHVYENPPDGLSDDEFKKFMKTRKAVPVHKAKIEALADLIDELNGKPLLIAYHYRHDLEALRRLLGKDVPHIGSGASKADVDKIMGEWNAGELPVLVGHPSSMGHGLNLQGGGNDVCWFGPTWNLEEYMQFIRRVWRQGISGTVRVHHIVAQGTLDEAMLLRLGERAGEQQDARDAIKAYRSAMF